MNLYVIRHGEVDLNVKKLLNGRNDSFLTEDGIKQAKRASKEIKNTDIELVISSPLKRTKQTCEIINANKIPVIYDNRLLERNTNSLMYKSDSIVDKYVFYNCKNTIIYGDCEGFGSILERIKSFIEDIKLKYENKNILIVSHLDVCKAIYSYIENIYDTQKIIDFKQDNCEIKKYKIKI